MARQTKPVPDDAPLPPPAKTREGREDQMIELAFALTERRLREGTASAQETVHFLKQGSMRERLERDKLKNEVEVLQTRVKEMESRQSSEETYKKALAAFRGYAGQDDIEDPDEDPDFY